ncbi:hypothetical protein OAF83_03845, partial [Rubripirellula sp.]
RVVERTQEGKIKVHLSGWSPGGCEIKGQTLAAEIGSRKIAVVDTGVAFIALLVGPVPPAITNNDGATDTLPVQKHEAQAIAEAFLQQKGIDFSKHRLAAVGLAEPSSLVRGQHWIVTWVLKTPADGGQIFVLVDMEKQVRIVGGR